MREQPEHDPYSTSEDEGIPDLQAGTPERQWTVDPEEEALPGDRPIALDDFGTTGAEEARGESLSGRLAREEPEEQPYLGAGEPWRLRLDSTGEVEEAEETGGFEEEEEAERGEPPLTEEGGLGVGSDLSTDYEYGDYEGRPVPSGQVWDLPRPAGRLVAPDEGVREDTEPDEVAEEVGPDAGGYSAEEGAMRVERE